MILDREQRASDLATKADRDISPKLTDEQYHALLHYTFKAGFKHPVQLLEAFVGDLSGWHRNGSDEEELAGEWFSRAYSGMGGSDSFLYYLYDHETDINELEHIAVTFDHDPEEVYDEDPEEDYCMEWTQKETEKCRGLFPCKPRCQLRASASDHDRGNAEYICFSWCTWNVLYPWYPLYCYGVKPGMGSSYGGVFWK